MWRLSRNPEAFDPMFLSSFPGLINKLSTPNIFLTLSFGLGQDLIQNVQLLQMKSNTISLLSTNPNHLRKTLEVSSSCQSEFVPPTLYDH
jgi:hypothetical protein